MSGATPLAAAIRRGAWRRRLLAAGLCLASSAAALGGIAADYIARLAPIDPAAIATAHEVVDRRGRLLRPFATDDGRWRFAVQPASVDPRLIVLLQTYEDQRFRQHSGVDPLSMLRAVGQLLAHGRIVSGGSTLTMQAARLVEPRGPRSIRAKLKEMARAIQLERQFGKDGVLGLYLTLAPYGGNLEGIRAASLSYFGKEPGRLTYAEAALLVAIPQSPEARRPDRFPDAARKARDRVLARAVAMGVLAPELAEEARREAVPVARRDMPLIAPHLGEQLNAADPGARVVATNLDRDFQVALEALVKDRVAALGPDMSIAVIAIDHATGEVRAHVGAADYADKRRAGQIDMVRALRSPGSALKPFIYALAFEDGIARPETLIDDRPTRFGAFAPKNFDLTYQGTISVRQALIMSLNVPAVALLERVTPAKLAARLNAAGTPLVLPRGEAPTLPIALGGVGIRLADLAQAYAGLARGGEVIDLRWKREEPLGPARRLVEPAAAWMIGDILLGAAPPNAAAGGRIAFKTGTSYGYRDAWAVGFDGRTTIGVWVGRPDGQPVPGLVGRVSAAPILFDAFARLGRPIVALGPPPPGAEHVAWNDLPLPLRRVGPVVAPDQIAGDKLRIAYPPSHAEVDPGTAPDGTRSPLIVKVAGGVQPFTFLLDGAPLKLPGHRRDAPIAVGPGFARVTVIDATGDTQSVEVRVQ